MGLEDLKAQLVLALEWGEIYISGRIGPRACHTNNNHMEVYSFALHKF